MDEKEKQEMKEKAKVIAAETTELAKEAGKAAASKADELYNKLPLDKINEKLGGKVDVKSPKVKIGVFAFIIFLAVVICVAFFSGHDPVIPNDTLKHYEFLLGDKKLLVAYSSVLVVNEEKRTKIPENRGKETYWEYIARCKKTYSEKELKSYENHCNAAMKNIKAELDNLRKGYDLLKGQEKRRKILAKKAIEILNKNFDEGFDTCKDVKVGRCFYTGPDYGTGKTTIERYEGVAVIYNSQTGKTRERNINMTINLDEGLYIVEPN